MRNVKLAVAVLCVFGVMQTAQSAVTCSSISIATASSTPFSVTGNTCTDANNAAVTTGCQGGATFNGAGEAVYGLTLGASYSGVSISVNPTGTALPCSGTGCGFFPGIYLMDVTNANSCGSQACTNTTQTTSVTAATLNVPSGFAAGTYYFFVGDTGGDAPGCGPYSLSIAGTLPVKLQKFSVK